MVWGVDTRLLLAAGIIAAVLGGLAAALAAHQPLPPLQPRAPQAPEPHPLHHPPARGDHCRCPGPEPGAPPAPPRPAAPPAPCKPPRRNATIRLGPVAAERMLWGAYRAIEFAKTLYQQTHADKLKPLLDEAIAAYSKAYQAYKAGDYIEAVAWARVALTAAKSFTWAVIAEHRIAHTPIPPPPPPS